MKAGEFRHCSLPSLKPSARYATVLVREQCRDEQNMGKNSADIEPDALAAFCSDINLQLAGEQCE
jgi:hypothetical protein